jgi:hypothetical protein
MRHRIRIIVAALLLGGCAYQVGYDPGYVPGGAPSFIARGKLLLVMSEADRNFIYEGSPISAVGDFTTLTIPLGAIMTQIAQEVFSSCFSMGVEVTDKAEPGTDYVLAIEPDISRFMYGYTRFLDESFAEPQQQVTPEIELELGLKAYNHDGKQVLDKTYNSGRVAGESYIVTRRPQERINEAVHETLHRLMLQAAEDVRPLLVGECEITDLTGGDD